MTLNQLTKRVTDLEQALSLAIDYIRESPCDPDIYDDQLAAWTRLQSDPVASEFFDKREAAKRRPQAKPQILVEPAGWTKVEYSEEYAEVKRKYRDLDIWSPPGTKVTPIYSKGYPANGYPYDQEIVKQYLPEGSIWTVYLIDVDRSSSDVYLVEFPGVRFNSVSLAHVD